MKTLKLSILLLLTASYLPLHAQCYIETFTRGNTFPYVCNQDSFGFQLYTSALQPDSIIVYWGDNTSDTVRGPFFFGFVSHLYAGPGIYYPYFRLFSQVPGCNDTLVEFSAFGYLHPGVQDSLSYGNYNYVIVVDSCTSITGKAYIDKDSSCTFTAGDVPLATQQVVALYNNQMAGYTFTDALGNYTFFVPPSYSVRLAPLGNLISTLQPICNTSQSGNYFIPNSQNHFIFRCPAGYDAEIEATTTFLAQTIDRGLCFTLRNRSCDPYSNATVTFYLDNRVIVNTSQPASVYNNNGSGTSQNINLVIAGNTVSIPGLSVPPMGFVSGCFQVRANPQLTTLNDTVCYAVGVTPVTGDVNPANNMDTACAVVLTSYDPNDKDGIINGRSAHGTIKANEDIVYKIRFQNTGNFPAKDVRIVDTIDANLNVGTIEIISFSHPMVMQQAGNVLTFLFNDIWLPDSTSNEPESHGYVTFRISQQPNLPPLTVITNFVDIYFDYNPPVRTNTVVSIIEDPLGIASQVHSVDAIIYPNPSEGRFTVSMSRSDSYQIKVYDIIGHEMIADRFEGMQWQWSGRSLPSGVYMVEITGSQYRQVMKLLIK
jgi:uncharacterized repeat protein (TIGR01451 family)